MSVRIEDVKYVDKQVKIIVNGYIRRCQQLLPTDNAYYNISPLVVFTCILYYNELEHFDKDHCGPQIKISDPKKRTITIDKRGIWQTVFGKKKINPQSNTIIKYEFIINEGVTSNVAFGFAANADNYSCDGSISGLYGTFGLLITFDDGNSNGNKVVKQFANSSFNKSEITLGKGDKLTMILDLTSNELWFQKGAHYENNRMKLFQPIPDKNYAGEIIYKMFVEMKYTTNEPGSVTLLNVEAN